MGTATARASSGQVFVDDAGRRAGWVGLAGGLLCFVALSYVVLLAAALVGAPWVPHGTLPLAGPVRAAGSPPPPIAAVPATPPMTGRGAPGPSSAGRGLSPSNSGSAPGPATVPSTAGPLTSPVTAVGGPQLTPPPPGAPPLTGPAATRPAATTFPTTAPGKSASHGPTTTAKPGRH